MQFDLDMEDLELIEILQEHCGLLKIEAWVFVLTATKQIARAITVPRLIEILKLYHYYGALPGDSEINQAIRGLIDKGLLSLVTYSQGTMVNCQDPSQAIRSAWNDDAPEPLRRAISILSQKMEDLEKGLIQILGPATAEDVGSTFMRAIEDARVEIKLPVFSTRSHGPLRDALERAISRGVRVKLLMYSPRAARLTYGGDYDKEIVMMAGHWRLEMKELNRKGPGRLQVRMIEDLDHLHFSGGLLVDGRLYRYALRFPGTQRGHEAIVITGHAAGNERSNFLMLLNYYFDIAWSKAIPIDFFERLLHLLSGRTLPR